MAIEVRQVCHPDAVKRFDTDELRKHFLIEKVFVKDEVKLTYSHIDRIVVGGAMPVNSKLELTAPFSAIGTNSFMDRRELGIINIGNTGKVTVGNDTFEIGNREALYVGMKAGEVSFASNDPAKPAKFYLVSTPAHHTYPTKKVGMAEAKKMAVGDQEHANKRVINQLIHPNVLETCQLVMGLTYFEAGSMWNTMPCHTHDRRCEAYLYFDMDAETRVVHLMGEPTETRHLMISNEDAILCPGWSIHSGVGTASYAFIWAMGGDNIDYNDMDMVPMQTLR
ncbi:5-dehydro-4-deoxy-D-glucuronate isomerase [Microvirga sp. W0021]|uniref:4-deoxy-L-threo-5-hexosulose-uronate ketol-isomerase n=1 Tax=Hohaiivirga grylli TaxID=3133970 RepID=A0ABV0BGN5_9HYPH